MAQSLENPREEQDAGMVDGLLRRVNKAVNWLLYTKEQQRLLDRAKAMQVILRQDKTTSAEILKADFGTGCPNGLDIDEYPQAPVNLKKLQDQPGFEKLSIAQREKEFKTVGGRAGAGEEIYIHPGYLNTVLSRKHLLYLPNIVSHENAHRMQYEEHRIGWRSASTETNVTALVMPVFDPGLKGQFKKLHQYFNHLALDGVARLRTKFAFDVGDYFAKEMEVQARMQEVLAQGYAGWQKMPTSKLELWAAFKNLGMPMPVKIRQEFESSPEGAKVLQDFRVSSAMRHALRGRIREINYLQDYAVFEDRKEYFWRHSLPAMYGDLLEQYGDRQGRGRMDMGTNPRPALDALRALKDEGDALSRTRIGELVATIPPEWANEFLASICRLYQMQDNVSPKYMQAVDALFARPDARAALLDCKTIKLSSQEQGNPAWMQAVSAGQTNILQKYIDAGFDFSTTIDVYDHYGNKVTHTGLLEHAAGSGEVKKRLRGALKGLNKEIRSLYNDESNKESLRQSIAKTDKALQYIAEHCPDPDKKMAFRIGQKTGDLSMNDLLEEAGIPRVGPDGKAQKFTLKDGVIQL